MPSRKTGKRKKPNPPSASHKSSEEEARQKEMAMAAKEIDRLRASGKAPGWSGIKQIRKWRDASKSS
jgi:hypothetical protein